MKDKKVDNDTMKSIIDTLSKEINNGITEQRLSEFAKELKSDMLEKQKNKIEQLINSNYLLLDQVHDMYAVMDAIYKEFVELGYKDKLDEIARRTSKYDESKIN